MDDRISIGNDHGGYLLKRELMAYLDGHGFPHKDCGSDSEDIVRYPHFANQVAEAVSKGEIARGILICSTGIGMSIIANRYPAVRASNCMSTYQARITRAHNDSNILCLGGKTVGTFEAIDMLDAWLNAEYEGGRHDISLGLIRETEQRLSGQA